MSTDLVRQLKIKTSSCARLRKEIVSYENETNKQEELITKMRQEGKDDSDIRKQEEVLEESTSMISDSKSRLFTAQEVLKEHMDVIKASEHATEIEAKEEWTLASAQLADFQAS